MAHQQPPIRPFVDLRAQRRRLGGRIEAAIDRVLEHGQFVMGPEVGQLETALAAFAGVEHVIACASGTDALLLVLAALGIGPGDAVFVPAFTFVAPAEAVALRGATPVLVDVDPDDFTLSPTSLERAVGAVAAADALRPRAVIPVDLFGQPADYRRLRQVAEAHHLFILQDAAQSFGATVAGEPAGRQGDAATTSFYPSKPLGAYGDGGAVLTGDADLAATVRALRTHGVARGARHEHRLVGWNSRLDTLQAAIVLAKLDVLEEEIDARQTVARRYDAGLGDLVEVPRLRPGVRSSWAQYTVRVDRRDRVKEALAALRVPTAVHYPRPLDRQPAYRACPLVAGGVPVAEALAGRVLSLPIDADLGAREQDLIVRALRDVSGAKGA